MNVLDEENAVKNGLSMLGIDAVQMESSDSGHMESLSNIPTRTIPGTVII